MRRYHIINEDNAEEFDGELFDRAVKEGSALTVNSISGGKTSAYIAAHHPADYNMFALVRTDDIKCKYPDEKVRQMVSDKLGTEFIGTLEDDVIIKTIFDLEQFIGSEVTWVTGMSFDESITYKGEYLPNKIARYCTTELKTMPMLKYIHDVIKEPVIMRFGYRANEQNRAKNMMEKLDEDGFTNVRATFRKRPDGKNHWEEVRYCRPEFPLIKEGIFRDNIEEYWKDKPVQFAWMNNCVGCWWRNELLLKKMFEKHPAKMEWFAEQERTRKGTFRNGITYDQIKAHKLQIGLFDDDDFSDCDSGHCGL